MSRAIKKMSRRRVLVSLVLAAIMVAATVFVAFQTGALSVPGSTTTSPNATTSTKIINGTTYAFTIVTKEGTTFTVGGPTSAKNTEKPVEAPVGSLGGPACPTNLSGIFTAPFIDPKYIAYMLPLGNVNPPGHAAPADHWYPATSYDGVIPLYAPANATITVVWRNREDLGNVTHVFLDEYELRYRVCSGLTFDIGSYQGFSPQLQDALSKLTPDCPSGNVSPEHPTVEQCSYPPMEFPVRAGEQVGWLKTTPAPGTLVGFDLHLEIWTANYNQPARTDVNWAYYNDERYAHTICFSDLYTGTLKEEYEQTFGGIIFDDQIVKRTIAPVCGQVNQDIVGTIQGFWFIGPPSNPGYGGLAFIHNNVDPTYGEVSIGLGIAGNNSGVITFQPTHSGTVNREPSEVRANGQLYCYSSALQAPFAMPGKVLVQLIGDHQLKVEYQSGTCGASEAFQSPSFYQR
jgi:hypothetical protein